MRPRRSAILPAMTRRQAAPLLVLAIGVATVACRKGESDESAAVARASAPSPAVGAATPDRPAVDDALRAAGIAPERVAAWIGDGDRAVLRVRVPGRQAIATWEKLRTAIDRTGYWPVVVGTNEAARILDDVRSGVEARTPASVLEAADRVDVEAWLAARREEDPHEPEEGEWPSRPAPNESFSVHADVLTRKPHAEVWLALVPTPRSSDVPAFLPFGAWNECPADEVHVAMLRRWEKAYGAELVCLSNDVMELRVPRRPAQRDEAMRLAREQYVYCVDVVDQGVGDLAALAADRMVSPVWYFWWD
jgi:hypothetical protein